MSEAVFPLVGAAFVVLFMLPLCALLAKGALMLLERDEVGGPLHGLNLRYLLITGSSALPLAWFVSAGVHQAESGKSAVACLLDHDAAALCFEPVFFALVLGVVILGCATPCLRSIAPPPAAARSERVTTRLTTVLLTRPALAALRGRVVVTDEPGFAIGTHGWMRPRVFVGASFADQLSDDMLASALGHEGEHVRSLDPLRYLSLRLALAVNPFGRFLLSPHAARWSAAREAHCDREAVLRGSLPLALAAAIIRAARPTAREAVALGAPDAAMLKFRIGLLLAFAERSPPQCCEQGRSAFPSALMLLGLALLLPHQTGTAALDALHTGAEHALTYFWP